MYSYIVHMNGQKSQAIAKKKLVNKKDANSFGNGLFQKQKRKVAPELKSELVGSKPTVITTTL